MVTRIFLRRFIERLPIILDLAGHFTRIPSLVVPARWPPLV